MKAAFTLKSLATIAAPLLVVAAMVVSWSAARRHQSKDIHVRFLGYGLEAPSLRLGSSLDERINASRRGARVARFSISNASDFPVVCSLFASYTNGTGSFFPRDVALEPRAATNITGLASPPIPKGSPQWPRAPTSAEWTNSWRLVVGWRDSSPAPGSLAEKRFRAALWLYARKYYRLGNWLNPLKVHMTQTEWIGPDLR